MTLLNNEKDLPSKQERDETEFQITRDNVHE
jgi:hypothetical protein